MLVLSYLLFAAPVVTATSLGDACPSNNIFCKFNADLGDVFAEMKSGKVKNHEDLYRDSHEKLKLETLQSLGLFSHAVELNNHSKQNTCSVGQKLESGQLSSDTVIDLQGDNQQFDCNYLNNLRVAGLTGEKDIRESLEKTNWNPCCLTSDIKAFLEANTDRNVRGFVIGQEVVHGVARVLKAAERASKAVLSAKSTLHEGVGGVYGKELVVMVTPEDTLQVGIVQLVGGGLEINFPLPLGSNWSQAVVFGDCESIDSYLGHFKSVTIAGWSYSEGMTKGVQDYLGARRTGCDSRSLVTGISVPVIGIEDLYYSKPAKFYELRGPRIKELVKALRRSNRNNSVFAGEAGFRKDDYSQENCSDNFISQIANDFWTHGRKKGIHGRSARSRRRALNRRSKINQSR